MKVKASLIRVFSVVFLILILCTQSEGAKVWSGKPEATAVQGESTTLVWTVTLTISDANTAWTYVKILHSEGANTEELVTFKKTGEKVINNPSYNSRVSDMTFNISQSGSTVTIQFTMANLVRNTDMKSYKAMLGFSNDASTYPDVTVLTILVKPHSTEFKIKPEKSTFCLGDKINVTCKVDGIPPAQISILLNNQLIQSARTSLTLLNLPLNVKGENNFICVPNNTAGIGQTKSTKLVVRDPPKIVRCRINGEDVTSKSVIKGTNLNISCQVTGSEPLSITWKKENEQASLSHSNSLTFGSIQPKDSGQYRLTAYNGRECESTVTKTLDVTVLYLDKPVVQGNAYKVISPTNLEAHFKITVDANPNPRLTCHKEGVPGNHSVVRAVSGSKSTFSINIYVKSHFVGYEEYTCSLRNTGGTRHIKLKLFKRMVSPILIPGTLTLTNMSWTEDLNKANSDSYVLTKLRVTQALNLVYGSEEFVTRFQILGFVKGSVAVNFQLHIIANVTDPIILLKNAVGKNGGQLNGLVINTASIKKGYSVAKEDGKTSGKSSETDDNMGLKLGLGLGLGLPITILGFVICWCCLKRKGNESSSQSTGQPNTGFHVSPYPSNGQSNTGYAVSPYPSNGSLANYQPGRDSTSNGTITFTNFRAGHKYPDGSEDYISADKMVAPANQVSRFVNYATPREQSSQSRTPLAIQDEVIHADVCKRTDR